MGVVEDGVVFYLAADAMILRMILHTTSKMPLVVGKKSSGFLGSGGPSVSK